MKRSIIAQRWDKGKLPRIVPLERVKPWHAMGIGRTEYFARLSPIERQAFGWDVVRKSGSARLLEIVRGRISTVREVRRRYCRQDRLPVDDLLEAFGEPPVERRPPPPLGQPITRGPRATDIRDLLEHVAEHKPYHLPGIFVFKEGTITTTTHALAAQLGCSKSTIHAGLRRLQRYGVVRVDASVYGTDVTLLRRRGEQSQVPQEVQTSPCLPTTRDKGAAILSSLSLRFRRWATK